MSRFWRETQFPKLEGMLPSKLLSCRFESIPIESGILPVIIVSSMLSAFKFTRLDISLGIIPCILFPPIRSFVNVVDKLVIELGNIPPNLLSAKSKNSSFLQLHKEVTKSISSGTFPVKLLYGISSRSKPELRPPDHYMIRKALSKKSDSQLKLGYSHSEGISPWKELSERSRIRRNERFPIWDDRVPPNPWPPRSKTVTRWCFRPQVTPGHRQKFTLAFQESRTPCGSSVIPDLNVINASLSVSFPGMPDDAYTGKEKFKNTKTMALKVSAKSKFRLVVGIIIWEEEKVAEGSDRLRARK
nr:hypothetical protein EUGRSUZ_E00440 [Ipomoea batatas]